MVLELGPGSHQIIRDPHNCTSSLSETCFQGESEEFGSTHQMGFASIYLTFSISFILLSYRRLVKKSPNVNSGGIINHL